MAPSLVLRMEPTLFCVWLYGLSLSYFLFGWKDGKRGMKCSYNTVATVLAGPTCQPPIHLILIFSSVCLHNGPRPPAALPARRRPRPPPPASASSSRRGRPGPAPSALRRGRPRRLRRGRGRRPDLAPSPRRNQTDETGVGLVRWILADESDPDLSRISPPGRTQPPPTSIQTSEKGVQPIRVGPCPSTKHTGILCFF